MKCKCIKDRTKHFVFKEVCLFCRKDSNEIKEEENGRQRNKKIFMWILW